ncbi:putative disease resistance RPP13-like protein 1 [Rosa rugosa]|uniref:putative disease resistance RPP13-like protein 1 n=1 Tax=Rosa rugosa TaxID=74645 RepID=UPI002B40BBF4|nr:putative disease resistance RPP13-like protein 1 [Rosa rugosa]
MPIVRALESASVSILLNKLATQDVIDFFLKWKIDDSLREKLKRNLLVIHAVLNHAEEKQVRDSNVKAWLEDVRVAAYDAEDILDDIANDALESQNSKHEVWNSKIKEGIDFKIKDIANTLNPFRERIESKMIKIIDVLEEIAKQKDILRLREDSGGIESGFDRLPTTPMLGDESHVYGRESDKEEIITLLNLGGNDDGVSIIPIVGMGGIGKTTLAQLVYNDANVSSHFDLRAWACVSDVFDVQRITKTLVESATKSSCSTNNLELLQEQLKIRLKNKKFLFVLDDVWNEKYESWDKLRVPFTVGAPGSKIIITTRNKTVASLMRTVPTYCLEGLSDSDCWLLFEQIVFQNRNLDAYPKLKVIGKKIAYKCKGLPLAAKALGGLLRAEPELDENYWNDILNSKLWKLADNTILPALRLSYHHLPGHLKRCFAYCSMFPKDYEYEREMLILLWMAEGFVPEPEGNQRIEDVAGRYVSDFLSRSFFQHTSDKSRLVMHDLIHDLAQSVSGKTFVRLEENSENHKKSTKARHLSYTRGSEDVFQKFEAFSEVDCLRTFLPLDPLQGFNVSGLSDKVPCDMMPKLRLLRVLSFSGYLIEKLPDSIGNLKHLRYLNLSYCQIEELPEPTSSLYNLQTLILFRCRSLTMLPADIGNLRNLRHLNIQGTRLKSMPLGMGRLVNLQILSDFIVGKALGKGIAELKDLSHLRGSVSIFCLHDVSSVRDAIEARLEVKKHLDDLVLEWSSSTDGSRNEEIETEVLDALQPHENLKKLTIKYYGGTEFPYWMGNPLFTNMAYLHLYGCIKCTSLPPLGQLPFLKDLIIEAMHGIQRVGMDFFGDDDGSTIFFPSLETLKFEDMKEWEKWSSSEDEKIKGFPSLRELSIFRCPKLTKFTRGFASLEKLLIKNCGAITTFSQNPALGNLEPVEFPSLNLEPVEFPSLQLLVLVGCSELENLPFSLPLLKMLDIDGCEKLAALPRMVELSTLYLIDSNAELLGSKMEFSSLTSLHLTHIPDVKHLPEGFIQQSAKLEKLSLTSFPDLEYLADDGVGLAHLVSLQRLTISHCPKFVALPDELPPVLKYLDLKHCPSLVKLPGKLHNLECLAELQIEWCSKIEAFPDVGLPDKLKRLVIRECGALKTLPQELLCNNNFLEYLEVHKCPSLVSVLEEGNLPSTLTHMKFYYCKILGSLPEGLMHKDNMTLKYLEIDNCSSLMSFPNGELPTGLERLEISDCSNFQTLPLSLLNLTNLETLEVKSCPLLQDFPEGGLPPNIKFVTISECENLKSLPKFFHKLKCLQKLEISGCPSLLSLPKQGLPSSLRLLTVTDCEKLNPIHQWRLHKLPSLDVFTIGGFPGLKSFSKDYPLPHSLTSLSIQRFPDLESISEVLENLTSLENLSIRECDKLQSLPETGLPATISTLTIRNCLLLEPRCEKDKGEDWSKIKNIPFVSSR